MKLAIMALLFLLTAAQPCPCQEKSCMVGIDLTSFTRSSACISASHSFGTHWSVSGEASISYKRFTREKSELEQEHDAEFSIPSTLPQDSHHARSSAIFSYWPTSAFNGAFIAVGVQSDLSVDIITEIGYMMPVWKGVSLSSSVRTTMIQGISSSIFRIGLHYRY